MAGSLAMVLLERGQAYESSEYQMCKVSKVDVTLRNLGGDRPWAQPTLHVITPTWLDIVFVPPRPQST